MCPLTYDLQTRRITYCNRSEGREVRRYSTAKLSAHTYVLLIPAQFIVVTHRGASPTECDHYISTFLAPAKVMYIYSRWGGDPAAPLQGKYCFYEAMYFFTVVRKRMPLRYGIAQRTKHLYCFTSALLPMIETASHAECTRYLHYSSSKQAVLQASVRFFLQPTGRLFGW